MSTVNQIIRCQGMNNYEHLNKFADSCQYKVKDIYIGHE